ncbi:5252_t:CDS:2, partial [Racocetra persica]
QPSPSRQSVQQTYSRQLSPSQPTSRRASRLLSPQPQPQLQQIHLRNEMQQRNVQGTQGIQGEDLSAKEVYISVVKRLFLRIIYSTQDEIKESLKDYLNEKFTEFVANLSANDFANQFH